MANKCVECGRQAKLEEYNNWFCSRACVKKFEAKVKNKAHALQCESCCGDSVGNSDDNNGGVD